MAVAASMLTAAYFMLRDEKDYHDLGGPVPGRSRQAPHHPAAPPASARSRRGGRSEGSLSQHPHHEFLVRGARRAESSTPCSQAGPLSMPCAEQLRSVGDVRRGSSNGRAGRRSVPWSRTPFLALPLRASTRQQFQDPWPIQAVCTEARSSRSRIAIQLVRVERSRLGPPRPDESLGRSRRQRARQAWSRRCWNPRDRDLHPICTLCGQTPRRLHLMCVRKYLKNMAKIWSRRADSNS